MYVYAVDERTIYDVERLGIYNAVKRLEDLPPSVRETIELVKIPVVFDRRG